MNWHVSKERRIPVAVNIGKNKATPNEEAHLDYEKCIRALYDYADLFVVNISSPNTPDLRNLQHGNELKELLAAVMNEMEAQRSKSRRLGQIGSGQNCTRCQRSGA